MRDEREELRELMDEFKTAILVTRGRDEQYHARPMQLHHNGPEGALWFSTSLDSQKVADLRADPHCAVALHDGGSSPSYVSISGIADLVQDRELIRQMWDPSWKAWFPDGPDEADLVLVRVRPLHAEYVNPKGGRAKVLMTMIRRLITHEHLEPDEKHQIDLPH